MTHKVRRPEKFWVHNSKNKGVCRGKCLKHPFSCNFYLSFDFQNLFEKNWEIMVRGATFWLLVWGLKGLKIKILLRFKNFIFKELSCFAQNTLLISSFVSGNVKILFNGYLKIFIKKLKVDTYEVLELSLFWHFL